MTPQLAPYIGAMKQIKIGEYIMIPWDKFSTPKPNNNLERPVSDGERIWVLTSVATGIKVLRIK